MNPTKPKSDANPHVACRENDLVQTQADAKPVVLDAKPVLVEPAGFPDASGIGDNVLSPWTL